MRGKHAPAAETRRKIHAAEASIESYQHHIQRLTAENRELKQRMADIQRTHSREVKVLKAQRDEGLSPMVSVLQRENKQLKERLDKSERDHKKWRKAWNVTLTRWFDHMKVEHGLRGTQAVEAVMRLMHEEFKDTILIPEEIRTSKGDSAEKVERLAKAKGLRW
jgi:septal ring factor EnvC (AmiA/AmiB activator)